MTYLIYEGPDQSGKTSTRKLVEKQRNGKDVVIDRFIGSNIVYGIVFNRYSNEEIIKLYYDDYVFGDKFDPVLVYLYAPAEYLIDRMQKDKHEEIDKELLEKTIIEYENYFEKCSYENKIKIDTSKFSQKEVVAQIIEFLKKC